MLGLDDIFGAAETERAGDIRAQGAIDAQKAYAESAEKERGAYTEAGETAKKDILEKYEEGIGYTAPYREAGATSLDAYMNSLGLGGAEGRASAVEQFKAQPGFQFAMEQGVKAREAAAAAAGHTRSGSLLKELTKYGQGMAEQEYGNWQKKLQDQAQFGGTIAQGTSQQAIGTGQVIGGTGMTTGGRVGQSFQKEGESAASSILGAAEARASSLEQKGKAGTAAGGLFGGIGAAIGKKFGGDVGGSLGGLAGNIIGAF